MKPIFRQDLPPVAFLDHATDLLTVGDLKDITSPPTQDSTPDKCTTWTDEKHSLYLNHLESSFIKQLHRSMGLSRWRSEHENEGTTVTRKLSANEQHASEKYLVPTGEKRLGWKRSFSNESATSSDEIPVSRRTENQPVGCLEEFSDQNFEEDILEKSSEFMSKRSRTFVVNPSSLSQDQIVPVCKKSVPSEERSAL